MGYKTKELTRTTLCDRIEKLLVSLEWSDCNFSVAGKAFKAHKLILGISSPVFKAMFYGPLSTNESIIITDIEPDIFQLLIKYIYTDKVELSSIDQAFELLYASRKYILEHLTGICMSYIQANISVDNVITILNYSEYMQDIELMSAAMKLFCEHAHCILHVNKHILAPMCMKAILKNEHMNIQEKNLIKYVFNWTLKYCEENYIPVTHENRRSLLFDNDLFKLLRFSTLCMDEFDEIITDMKTLLLPNEIENIKNNIIEYKTIKNVDHISQKSVVIPRKSLKIQWHLCNRRSFRPVPPIKISSNNCALYCRIKTSKPIFINSLCIPTKMKPVLFHPSIKAYTEQIHMSVTCEDDNSIIECTNFMNTVEYDSVLNVEFPEPCFIKKDKWYKINFVWPHNRCHSNTGSYLANLRENFYNDKQISIEFDDVPFLSTAGSFLEGLKFCL